MDSFLALFKPPPDIDPLPPDEVKPAYRYWRLRQLYSTFTGYFVFYFVRVNLPVAIPLMERDLGLTRSQLGGIQSLHAVVYGTSKFLNGMLADRSNPRYFMAVGLVLSGVVNICFGLSSGLYALALFWILNGWFQGMGFPPCARVLSHWYSPKERGRFWSIWNTSHQIGGAAIFALAGYLAAHYGWRSCFIVPAGIAFVVAVFLIERVRDTPGSLGLPPVEYYTGEADVGSRGAPLTPEAFKRFLAANVFTNPTVWLVCAANFFVYIIRYGFMNWVPDYLYHMKQVPLQQAGAMTSGFELAGIFGSVLAGWLSDKFCRGRRAPVCVVFMLLTSVSIGVFWKLPPGVPYYYALSLAAVGFLVYGPQLLVGLMLADVATRQAAATAIGLSGFFGYVSQVISGWGLGHIVDSYGWDAGFKLLIGCSLAGVIPFLLCWKVAPVSEEEVYRRMHLLSPGGPPP